jgi:hypothetical protein
LGRELCKISVGTGALAASVIVLGKAFDWNYFAKLDHLCGIILKKMIHLSWNIQNLCKDDVIILH